LRSWTRLKSWSESGSVKCKLGEGALCTGDGNDLGAVVEQAGDVRIAITSSPDSGFTEGEVTVAKVSWSEPEAGQEPQEPLEQEDLREEMTGYPWVKTGRVLLDNFDERMPASFTVNQSTDPLDNWQWRNPLPQGNHLLGVTYGDGTFVAVGNRGTILTSPDGETWAQRSSGNKVIVYAKDHYAPATDQFAVWDKATVECHK
jgi:hypothetical protein